MRIALVTTEYVTEPSFAGGLSNYTHKVALGLKELGHTPEVFVWGWGQAAEVFEHDGVRIERCSSEQSLGIKIFHRLQKRLFKNRKKSLVRALADAWGAEKRIRERHSTHSFDLIHYTHLGGSGVFLRRSIPSVVRLSCFRDLWEKYGYQQEAGHVFGEDRSIRRAHGVISPSNWVGEYVSEKFGRPINIIESPFVPTVTEPDNSVFQEQLAGIGKFGLYFGSLAEWKGVYVLAESLRVFLRDHPDYHFVFVGRDLQGDQSNPPWQRICQAVGSSQDRLHRLHSLRHAQLFPVIQNAEFVALPSLAENFPNAALEAMSLGKVVIGTDGRSFEQLINHGDNGFLCKPGDPTSLADAMSSTAKLSPDEAIGMGEKAKDRIGQLSIKIAVARLAEFYNEVIAAHPKNWQER